MTEQGAIADANEQSLPVMLQICAYCACLWAAGHICRHVRVSAAIGEILTGVLLGPAVLDIVPYAAVFELAGVFGVTFMVFESGLHVNFDAMRTVGAAATGVAFFGSLIPLGLGMLMMFAIDPVRYPPWPTGLAIGIALAPTSVGLALKMLKEARRLHAREGQLIMAAAFLDDVISLVLLTTLLEIGRAVSMAEDLAPWRVLRPLVLSLAFCALALGLGLPPPVSAEQPRGYRGWLRATLAAARGVVPRALSRLRLEPSTPQSPPRAMVALRRTRTPARERSAGDLWADAPELPPPLTTTTVASSDAPHAVAHAAEPTHAARAHAPPPAAGTAHAGIGRFECHALLLLMAMLGTLVGFCALGDVVGSHLLGAFLAGVVFAAVPGALAVWHQQVKRIAAWLVRFFFGGTVAFAVPIRAMLAPRALAVGTLLCVGPACIGKLIGSAAAGWHDVAIVGAAMLGRGEFGFLVVETARALLLNPAPGGFAGHELALRLQRASSGGGWCVDGDCGDGVPSDAPGEPTSYQRAGQWCAHCEGGRCDTEPRFGVRYWQLGADCDAWPAQCECESMLGADVFAIAMWAIVGSSLVSPLLFGLALHKRARAEAAAAAARKPPGRAANGGARLGVDADGAQQWLGIGHSPYLRADLMI